MRDYKFYLIGKDGHISAPAQEHELPDDRAAVLRAHLTAQNQDIEIWEGARLVAYVIPETSNAEQHTTAKRHAENDATERG